MTALWSRTPATVARVTDNTTPIATPEHTVEGFVREFLRELNFGQGTDLTRASVNDKYLAMARTVRHYLMVRWLATLRAMARYLSFTDAFVRSVPWPKLSSRRNSRTKPSTVCSGVAMGVVVSVTLATLAALCDQFMGLRQFVTNEQVTGLRFGDSLSRC